GVRHDLRLPREECVEKLADLAATASASRGDGLTSVVTPADDLALRGARLHAPCAIAEHRVQEIPGAIVAQCEQPLVDGGKGELGPGNRLAALRNLDAHDGLLPNRVLRLV